MMTSSYVRVDGVAGGLFTINGTVFMSNALMVVTNQIQLAGSTNALAWLTVEAGAMYVTNAQHTGLLQVQNGVLSFAGGPNYVDNLVLTNGAVLQFILGSGSSAVQVTSNLTLSGTLNVFNSGGMTSGTYRLFNYGGSLTGSNSLGAIPVGYACTLNATGTHGQVNLVVVAPATPSGFQITSIVRSNSNIVLTWSATGGTTNKVQSTNGVNGNYTNNFVDIGTSIILSGSGFVTTNYTDVGGATNSPSHFYRIRQVPGSG